MCVCTQYEVLFYLLFSKRIALGLRGYEYVTSVVGHISCSLKVWNDSSVLFCTLPEEGGLIGSIVVSKIFRMEARLHLQPQSCYSLLPYELHDQHVCAQLQGFWTSDSRSMQPCQIAQLFLCPHLHHLARIALAIALESGIS